GHIWSYKKDAYVILEHFTENSEEKILTAAGMSVWGNSNYNYNQATMGYTNGSDFSWISYKSRGFSNPAGVMGYMESHDEERLMFKNEQYGNASGSYNVKSIPTALKRMEEAGLFFFTIPGPKMIWQFGELGYDISINQCENGTLNDGCRTSPKPILWDYYNNADRKHLYGVWSALIHLKETEPVFKTTDFTLDVGGATKRIQLNSTDMDVTILGNFNVTRQNITPYFQKTGWWYEYFTGDSVNVTNTEAQITLDPGEYRFYTTKRLKRPDFILGVSQNEAPDAAALSVYPNPTTAEVNIKWDMQKKTEGNITLFDLTGRAVQILYNGEFKKGINHLHFNLPGLNKGLYFMVLKEGDRKVIRKLVIQ
ncbi:MAG TPA: T9SS type A sorting domain-containing protein, partial [Bacteroidetes bacterium]|nr:T9SS type A sorting domain-containing protein [Bacteroidota bacterium]